MKTGSFIALLALGVGAAFLLSKSRNATAEGGGFGGGSGGADFGGSGLGGTSATNTGADFQPSPFYVVRATTPQGITYSQSINSVQQGVDFINNAVATGQTIQRTSQTLATGISFTTAGGKTYTPGKSGTISTGIAQLGTGNRVAVAVVKPATDASGRTALDRIIAKNKALSGVK